MDNYLKLAKEHGGKEMAFKDLPRSHRLAIIHYMAINGEAWESPEWYFADDLPTNKQTMSFYLKKYGRCKFGIVEIPIDVMKASVFNRYDGIKGDFKDFNAYHEWYLSCGDIPKHSSKNRWPCIMGSCSDDIHWDVIEDGWHRFHRYIQLECKTIPCIYYLPKVNYKKIDNDL